MTVAPELIALAHRLADSSGQVIRPLFRQRIDVLHKQGRHDFDPVTEADRGAERAIRELLARERPDDGVLGEEFSERKGTSGYRWVLDPVDGTRAFITGRHEWGSLIALEQDGAPILGILDQPVLGERFIGVNGVSHLIQAGQASVLKARACASLSEAVLCATDPGTYFSREQLSAFSRVERLVKMARYGGDCYLFAALALGFVDVVIEAGFHEWDIAALIPLVEGAGGIVTNWQGGSARDGKTILASGDARVHQEAMTLLAG
ncbi:MAG TPA: histidinol-phosphatase [Rhizomicrobium sp.]|jgi:myo-inositol-1(or 4)-monophosphatase|nr:histidinol-phosphatase [Rhizomicrobium sp.]